jgi:hypothetical protein
MRTAAVLICFTPFGGGPRGYDLEDDMKRSAARESRRAGHRRREVGNVVAKPYESAIVRTPLLKPHSAEVNRGPACGKTQEPYEIVTTDGLLDEYRQCRRVSAEAAIQSHIGTGFN